YRVDTTTLVCTPTAYQAPPQSVANVGLAVSRAPDSGVLAPEILYVYGTDRGAPALYVGDLSSFAFALVGHVIPDPGSYPLELKADRFDRLFGMGRAGDALEI